ncbi:MAG TPA: hypothetical protein PLZ62_01885 [bacterium]|nr:hypothetical protein [bacterium]
MSYYEIFAQIVQDKTFECFLKHANFNFVKRRYVNIFLSDQRLEKIFRQCSSQIELNLLLEDIVNFITSSTNRRFTTANYQDLIKINFNFIKTNLLSRFCLSCHCQPTTILLHILPAIRQKIEIILCHPNFSISKVADDLLRLQIVLQIINYNFPTYLNHWFKIDHPWEAQENLQNSIAQKNIRKIIKHYSL